MSKRRQRRRTVPPRAATSTDALCAMPRDNVSSGDYWVIVDESTISFCHQKTGEDPTEGPVQIPRRIFERFVRWYDTGSMR